MWKECGRYLGVAVLLSCCLLPPSLAIDSCGRGVSTPEVVGRMKKVWINSVGPTFIEVRRNLDCSDRVGMVTGFRIYFCPITSPYNLTCREPQINTTVSGDPSTIHGKVLGLKPYTTYMVAVAVETKNGVGLQSDPLYNTTLEAAPEQPKEVTITDLTNSSMTVSWEPPAQINGVLRFYEVYYNNQSEKVELPYTQLVTTNLMSDNNYSVSVAACTVMCSKRSNPVIALTKIGRQEDIDDADMRPSSPVSRRLLSGGRAR